jgi:plastocyanin
MDNGMPMRAPGLILALASLLISSAAAPSDLIVFQKGRTFSVAALSVGPGTQVIFVNDDTVPHNIMSDARDNAFDLGLELPGSAIPVSFTRTGIVTVICAIHPRMQMTITVTD